MSYRSRATLEIGFAAAAGSLDPSWTSAGIVWTDVSSALDNYEVTAGSAEFEGVTPGSGFLVLENLTGTFDPSNAASPYFGNMTDGKPFRLREQINLLSLAQSTGDDVASLTAIGGASITVNGTQRRSLNNSVRVTNAAGTIGFTTAAGTSGFVVNPAEPLTASAWILRTTATGRSCTVSLRFYTAAGAIISTSTGSPVVSSGAWQQVSVQAAAPATAAYAALRVEIAGAIVGDIHFVDDMHVVASQGTGSLEWYPGGPIDIMRGQIESWLPAQEFPGYATCTLAVAGTLAPIAAAPYGDSLWSSFVSRTRPSIWWRLGERDETEPVIDSSGNDNHARYMRLAGGTPISFTDGLIAQDADGAVNFDAAWKQYIEGPATAWTSGTFTVALWIKAYPSASACTLFDSSRLTIAMTAAGAITATYLGLAATTVGRDVRDGNAHLIVVQCGAAGSVIVGVDQDDAASAVGILGAERLQLRMFVGRDQAGTVAQYATIVIDEVLLWQGVTIESTWLYLTGRAGGIRAGDLIARPGASDIADFLLQTFGSPRPLGGTAAPSGDGPLVLDRITMGAPLDMLNTASTAGQLMVREAPDGTPTVEPLQYLPVLYNVYLSPVTIGQGGTTEHPYVGSPAVDYGEGSVVNLVNVSRPDLAAVTYRNQASIDARGIRSTDVTLWSSIDRCARDLAGWILNQYGTAVRRLSQVQLDCTRIDTAQVALLLTLGDVITVKDQTVDGRTITTVVRVVGRTIWRRTNEDGMPILGASLNVATIRIQPIVLDSSISGVLGAAANTGKWGP